MIITEDGSTTLYSERFQDHYHSTFGAINESTHIFIKNGLHEILKRDPPAISILEIGLGTGLNALLTCINKNKANIMYTALEPYPLDAATIQQMNYIQQIKHLNVHKLMDGIHQTLWNEFYPLKEGFSFKKVRCKIEEYYGEDKFDLIYFDAFSPRVQPEIWAVSIFEKIFNLCQDNALLITYSSKGDVRRALQKAGFIVEKIPGPKGKREITRARVQRKGQ